jgi:phosphoglycerate dehydrogenase-like enzyme
LSELTKTLESLHPLENKLLLSLGADKPLSGPELLAAAGLDVWYNYPRDEAAQANTPPSQYPFHELDNVVMSPHRGGDEVGIDAMRMQHLAELLNAAARGEEMPNRVNIEAVLTMRQLH